MKKLMLTFSLATLVLLSAFVKTRPFAVETAAGMNTNEDYEMSQPSQTLSTELEEIMYESETSCTNPLTEHGDKCQSIEKQILNSSVRIMMYTSLVEIDGVCCQSLVANGYGTVKEGRYLVTHNHYNEQVFAMLQQGGQENTVYINIINTSGEVVLTVFGQDVAVRVVDGESLVLDFGEKDGLGVFEALGFSSTQFSQALPNELQPGVEVAQIDWDGYSAHIDWTTIEAVKERSETAVVKLANCIRNGASGGGLFLQGTHIGNNWSTSPNCDQEPEAESYSFVALNTPPVIES